ncbi:IS66 family insertion sequence element accessory protein TnpB [Acinetobacter baumannii]|uniref:IS66 family insertion sequence element accessory protein TnpB n=1 Tax=Acinetobacter baumannii TaxID=470 RepID=UPI00193E7EE2|nr:IS66 family insertion sequence element accessory protein TnpB [Acinetobacter baumannii]QRN21627.1 IS66 family insertion sequence element accessory protein TnpB [Acinetobacter baumannii]
MIRIDEIWLSTQPMDMRAGMDTTMAQVGESLGYIKPHCTYLFCNKRGHRMKVLVHDGLGIWLCARRLRANFTGLKFTKVKPWPSARNSYRH